MIQDSLQEDKDYLDQFMTSVLNKVASEGYLLWQAIADTVNDEMERFAILEMPAEEYVEKIALEIVGGYEENLARMEKEAGKAGAVIGGAIGGAIVPALLGAGIGAVGAKSELKDGKIVTDRKRGAKKGAKIGAGIGASIGALQAYNAAKMLGL
jgi:hypothetical protein